MPPFHLFLHSYSLRFRFQHEPGFDVFAFIDRAVAEGFTGVNISANGPGYRHLGGTTAAHFARVRQRLERGGLLVDLETSGTAPDHIEALLAVARALGAGHLRTYTRHRGDPELVAELTARDLAAAVPHAETAGVKILLENHEEFTGPEVAAILERVGSPWVGALYDYGNSMMVLEDPLAALAAMRPHVSSAHLKDHVMLAPEDSPEQDPSVLGVPIGSGNLPIIETTRRLVAAGVERIVFENVWGYRAPLRGRRGGARLGEGVFAFARPPFDPARCLVDPDTLASSDPARLIALEGAAFRAGLAWLRRRFAESGLPMIGPATGLA